MIDVSHQLRNDGRVPLRDILATAFRSWDFAIGLAAGGVAALCALNGDVRGNAPTVLIAELAVGLAVLAAVLPALTILTTFFDGHYRRVLDAAGGVPRAMLPYIVVAVLGGVGAVVALLTAAGWPAFGPSARIPLFALSTGLCVWTIAGVVSLVEITMFHGTQRAELIRGVEDVTEVRAHRLRERQPSR